MILQLCESCTKLRTYTHKYTRGDREKHRCKGHAIGSIVQGEIIVTTHNIMDMATNIS